MSGPIVTRPALSRPRVAATPRGVVVAAAGGGGSGGFGGGGPSSSAPPKSSKKKSSNKRRKNNNSNKSRPGSSQQDEDLDADDLEALDAARLEEEAEEEAAAAAAAASDGTGLAASNAAPSPEALYAALQPAPAPEPFVGPVRAARVEGGKAGVGVVATRTLAAGELALVCLPLAVLRRLPLAREGAGGEDEEDDAEGSESDDGEQTDSRGGASAGEQEEDAYEPDDDDLDALAAQLLSAAGGGGGGGGQAASTGWQRRCALAWLAYLESDDGSSAAVEPDLRELAGVFDDEDGGEDGRRPASTPQSAEQLQRACADATDLAFRVELEDGAASTLRRAIDEAAGAPVGPAELRRAAAGAAMDAEAAAEDAAAAAAAAASSSSSSSVAAPPGVPAAAVGLWPAFSLLNHSCAPTASVVAVDDPTGGGGAAAGEGGAAGGGGTPNTTPLVALHVRAARAVAKGAELTASHLPASLLLGPLSARQSALEREHGVAECRCARCRDERAQDPKLRALVEDLHQAATSAVAPALQRAVAEGDTAAVKRCRDQLAAYAEVADAAFARLALRPRSQLWAQASLFRLYEALALAVAASSGGGGGDPRLLELLAALAGLAAPGSREHVFWARQFSADASAGGGEGEGGEGGGNGNDDDSRRHADGVCYRAHEARYGRQLSRPLYGALGLAAAAAEEMMGGAGGDDEDEDDGFLEEEEDEQ
jgi:hypothetical protein